MKKKSLISSKDMGIIFADTLKVALRHRYQKVPTATYVANQFNIKSGAKKGVSPEIVRRWLKGATIPDLEKLLILKKWLGIDLNAFANVIEDKSTPINNANVLVETPIELEQIKKASLKEIEELEEAVVEKIRAVKKKYL